MRNPFRIAGLVAGVVLILFGIVTISMGASGLNTVKTNLKLEQISGTPDMTPTLIAAEAQKAGLQNVSLPTCTIASKPVTDGASAHCFASYMRIHTLEATGGQTFSQMARFASKDGKGTSDPALALKGPTGQPLDNQARNIWVTETALTTALNTAYMAGRLANSIAAFSVLKMPQISSR